MLGMVIPVRLGMVIPVMLGMVIPVIVRDGYPSYVRDGYPSYRYQFKSSCRYSFHQLYLFVVVGVTVYRDTKVFLKNSHFNFGEAYQIHVSFRVIVKLRKF